jgi:Flp pilus assembly protein TadD
MRLKLIALSVVASLSGIGEANAQDLNGFQKLQAGDYRAAELEIRQEMRLFPHDPDLLINLATVYVRTGRMAEARALYRDVLARADEELDVLNHGNASSHAVARLAISRTDQIAQR